MQALFSFHGRINRLQFVGLYFAQFAVVTGLALVGGVGVFLSLRAHNPLLIIPMIAPALVASLWMWFAISWKRMADIGVPRSLRRLLQLFWAVAGAIVMAVYGHSLLVRTLLGLVPLLMLALWPGQSDDDDLLATFGAPPPASGPPPPPQPYITPQPSAYTPAPAFSARPLQADGRPVFGRRGL